jgi:hypothetical protein
MLFSKLFCDETKRDLLEISALLFLYLLFSWNMNYCPFIEVPEATALLKPLGGSIY